MISKSLSDITDQQGAEPLHFLTSNRASKTTISYSTKFKSIRRKETLLGQCLTPAINCWRAEIHDLGRGFFSRFARKMVNFFSVKFLLF